MGLGNAMRPSSAANAGRDMSGLEYYPVLVSQFEHILVNPAIRFGKPCVKGSRIAVAEVLEDLSGGMSPQVLVDMLPQLTEEGILKCLAFAAERERSISTEPAA